MARNKQMKALEEMLAEKRNQLATLKVEIATLETALRRASGDVDSRPRRRRTNVKKIVLDILAERGDQGVNAGIVVQIAAERGEEIERATVSSLLSRMKADGIVTYDNVLYRLAQPHKATAEQESVVDVMH